MGENILRNTSYTLHLDLVYGNPSRKIRGKFIERETKWSHNMYKTAFFFSIFLSSNDQWKI